MLEGFDLFAEHELTSVHDLSDGRVHFAFDPEVLRTQIDERNHTEHLFVKSSTGRPLRIDCVAAPSSRTMRKPAWPSTVGVVLSSMQAMNCLSSTPRASAMSSCGDQTSPAR